MILRILTVAQREIKLGFRNAWTYSFLLLLSIFTTAILLLQSSVVNAEVYTDVTGTIMNMTLYVLPLITLFLGGFSVAVEKEDGQWSLLSTYPISVYIFLFGKFLGLSIILVTILFFSFGIAGIIMFLFGKAINFSMFIFLILFSTSLALIYVSIALLIGSIVKNRWQVLVGGMIIWFITIILWPMLLMGILSQLPSYTLVQPTLQTLTLLNPAEFVRVFSMMRIGAGSVFGADYDQWITLATGKYGILMFIGVFLSWIVASVVLGGFIWSRGDRNGSI